jgi:hypothetical protein
MVVYSFEEKGGKASIGRAGLGKKTWGVGRKGEK